MLELLNLSNWLVSPIRLLSACKIWVCSCSARQGWPLVPLTTAFLLQPLFPGWLLCALLGSLMSYSSSTRHYCKEASSPSLGLPIRHSSQPFKRLVGETNNLEDRYVSYTCQRHERPDISAERVWVAHINTELNYIQKQYNLAPLDWKTLNSVSNVLLPVSSPVLLRGQVHHHHQFWLQRIDKIVIINVTFLVLKLLYVGLMEYRGHIW